MARKLSAVVLSLGCLHASSTLALGLGDLTLDSFLNEPLKAEVSLLNVGNLHSDQIRIRLATREDFERMGVERAYFLTSIKFEVSENERGQPVILMSSEDPVLEPYLDFIVEARWPTGRLLREYTVLVDPPLFDESATIVSASERVAEVEGLPEAAAAVEKKTAGPAATSGTRVDVRQSNLAPGEMPQRNFNAETSDSPISGRRYMIHRDDTLWEIAQRAKPSGVSVHQTMLDIQRMNPDAFIDGNINRIKAGYIIYLPTEDEISSRDLSAALEEVRQQNEDWEAGRASKPIASTGPSLRISADPEESAAEVADSGAADDYRAGGGAAMEELERSELERSEMAEQLESMEEQVETLQRIVSLKDDQIAALQAALAEAGGGDTAAALVDVEQQQVAEDGSSQDDDAGMVEGEEAEAVAAPEPETAPESEIAPAPAPAPKPAPRPAPKPEPQSNLISYILYGVAGLVVALIGFFVLRRRGESEPETRVRSVAVTPVPAPAPEKDEAFAEVELKDEAVEIVEDSPAPEQAEEAVAEVPAAPERDNRGYGERKHDEYASDVDTGDALAEADIYIAYGRFPQAVDLLKNAVVNEPNNPAYHLKLLKMYVQMDDLTAAEGELQALESIGDEAAMARAGQIFEAGKQAAGEPEVPEAPDSPPGDLGEDPLESDFAGLEIEDAAGGAALEEELDLTAEFASEGLAVEESEEDLVIAAETDGMSTKLDLARAYLDMGDDDGARQILEEVALEGDDQQKAEANSLLERIG